MAQPYAVALRDRPREYTATDIEATIALYEADVGCRYRPCYQNERP